MPFATLPAVWTLESGRDSGLSCIQPKRPWEENSLIASAFVGLLHDWRQRHHRRHRRLRMTCPTRSRFEVLIEAARSGAASTTFTERNSLNIHAPSEAATSTENPNLSAALDLAVAGMPIFPTRPDKRPLLVGWQEKATTGPQQMHNWWHAHPARLPAIDVGRAGLVVIDCDRHPGGNDGIKAFNQLASGKGLKLANVPMTKTPRGGAHLFFKQPNGEPLGNGRGELPDGIDVRGAGGFVIAPGAEAPDGTQ